MTPRQFAEWFSNESARLQRRSAQEALDEIHERLSQVHPALAVEVSDECDELVVSADGDAALFPIVDQVCEAIRPGSWRVRALKPARGFEFRITVGDGRELDVSRITFEPLESARRPGELGLRLYAPAELVSALSEVTSRIVQIGVGEREAATIRHLEAAAEGTSRDEFIPIEQLGEFLRWRRARRGS